MDLEALISSIKITYFLRISIDFNKLFDLFREQKIAGSSPSRPVHRPLTSHPSVRAVTRRCDVVRVF